MSDYENNGFLGDQETPLLLDPAPDDVDGTGDGGIPPEFQEYVDNPPVDPAGETGAEDPPGDAPPPENLDAEDPPPDDGSGEEQAAEEEVTGKGKKKATPKAKKTTKRKTAAEKKAEEEQDSSGEDAPPDEDAPPADGDTLLAGEDDAPEDPADEAPPEDGDGDPAGEDSPEDGGDGPAEEPDEEEQTAPTETERPARQTAASRRRGGNTSTGNANTSSSSPGTIRVTDRDLRRALTVENSDTIETRQDREDAIWHEIRNSHLSRRMLTSRLGGVERNEAGGVMGVVYYKGNRIIIPSKELFYDLPDDGNPHPDSNSRMERLANNMLGCEIDFIVRGIDNKARSAVGSRRDAMIKKRRSFYEPDRSTGEILVRQGRVVETRVIAVSERRVRVEIFGVETSISTRELDWAWIGDARERWAPGDRLLVRIADVTNDNGDIQVFAEAKSLHNDTSLETLQSCRIQGKYAGAVTEVYKGVVFIRLHNGVNGIAHTCYDKKTPGKGDDITFIVTSIDLEHRTATGIISRVLRQNI